ncbi:MAG: hypothetical protein K2L95_00555 [Alphaproteobacteria bacterium]|nr:hypothetical protein [Alphaproteobacteria bacterium]
MKAVAKAFSVPKTDMAQFMLWVARHVRGASDGTMDKLKWAFLAGVFTLGYHSTAHMDVPLHMVDPQTATEQVVKHTTPKIHAGNTFGEFLDQASAVTPYLVGFLATTEGFELKPYQDSRGFWTIGIGNRSTPWGGTVGPRTPTLTRDQAYEAARWHLEEKETYMVMYGTMTEFCPDLTVGEFLGLASFVYNGGPNMLEPILPVRGVPAATARDNQAANTSCGSRWWAMRQIFRTDKDSLDSRTVHDLYEKYPVMSVGSVLDALRRGIRGRELANTLANFLRAGNSEASGLVWRRWLEACLISGDIKPEEIVQCPMGGGWAFMQYAAARGQHLIKNKQVNFDLAPMFIRWIKEPTAYDKRTDSFVPLRDMQSVESVMPEKIADLYRAETIDIPNARSRDLYATGSGMATKAKQKVFKRGGDKVATVTTVSSDRAPIGASQEERS